MKLVSKIIKYKLDSSSKMRFAIFYPKDIQNFFWKTIDFVKNLEMTQTVGGGDGGSYYLLLLLSFQLFAKSFRN